MCLLSILLSGWRGVTLRPVDRGATLPQEELRDPCPLQRLLTVGRRAARAIRRRVAAAARPAGTTLIVGVLADVARNRSALLAENALLRHQLIIMRRGVKRPRCTPADRALLVLLASRLRTWRQAVWCENPQGLCVLRWLVQEQGDGGSGVLAMRAQPLGDLPAAHPAQEAERGVA